MNEEIRDVTEEDTVLDVEMITNHMHNELKLGKKSILAGQFTVFASKVKMNVFEIFLSAPKRKGI